MSSMPTGHRVLCYNCGRTYARAEGGLECPHCGSDFVEVLEHAPSPHPNYSSPPPPPPPQLTPFSPIQNQQYIPRYDAAAVPPPTSPPQSWSTFTPPTQPPPFPTALFPNLPGMRMTNQRQFVVGNGVRFTTASFTNAPESLPVNTPLSQQPPSHQQQRQQQQQQQQEASPFTIPGQSTAQQQANENQRPPDQAPSANDNDQGGQPQAPEGINILRTFLDGIAHYLNPVGATAYERDVEQRQTQQSQQPSQHQQYQPSQEQPPRASSEPPNTTPQFQQTPRIAIYTSPWLQPRDADRPQAEAPLIHTLEELVCNPFVIYNLLNSSHPLTTSSPSSPTNVIYFPELIPVRFMRMAHGPTFAPPPGPPPNRTPMSQEEGGATPGQPQGAPGVATAEGVPQDVFGIPVHFITRFANAFGLDAEIFNIPSDAVFSEEALQAVIQQLAEQSGPSGPRPASQEAIDALPKKVVDESMLDDDGKAECSICMEPVFVGAEVTLLPCKHWFHGECITLWLKEHDSCPHCRKPIMTDEQRQRQEAEERERRRERIFSAHRRGPRAAAPSDAGADAAEAGMDRGRSAGPTTEERGQGDREGRTRSEDANAGYHRSGATGTQEHAPEQGAGQEARQETQDAQQDAGTTGARTWFFQGALPLFPRALAGLATNFRIVRSPSAADPGTANNATSTSEAPSPPNAPGPDITVTGQTITSHTQPPTAAYPSAAAHTLPVFTNAGGSDVPVYSSETTPTQSQETRSQLPRSFGVSNERRRQLEEQQQLSRESQREQDNQRRHEEQERDIGGRGLTQDFADWARTFGGMDPD
ncbi:hypothetical protein KEM54_004711 [Ascosphaera aggregata]|nr:hypothetical protein KEM54_004711 [Ascosphaera aggregata]